MSVPDLFRAEWIKIVGNRWVTSALIWIFPVGALAFVAVMSLILALGPGMRDEDGTVELGLDKAEWTERALEVWMIPNSLFGRLMILGFTAVVFAGEYQWQTWKNVVPRTRRVLLVLTKFLGVSVSALVAFALMSAIFAAGWGVLVKIAGGTYGPAITADVLSEFVPDYAQQVWLALNLTLIAASFAALAGMITRSILGGVLVGLLFTYGEGLSVLGLAVIGRFVDFPELVYLYRLTPSYNVANARSWMNNHHPAGLQGISSVLDEIPEFSDSLGFSAGVLLVWVIGLIALTACLFQRQDIT